MELAMREQEPDRIDQSATPAAAAPVTAAERIASLDVLRGVAILGILVMNIYAFAMPFPAYSNPLLMGGTEPMNIGTWFFTHILFDQKFLSIFAMLFGAGIILMSGRAAARGARYAGIYYRRQFWLVVLGALHAYFIWYGDILFMYALVGMLAFLFRNRTPRTLVIVACCVLPVAILLGFGFGTQMQAVKTEVTEIEALQAAGEDISDEQQKLLEDWDEQRAFVAPGAKDIQKDLDIHLGSYVEITTRRIPQAMGFQIFGLLFFGVWRVLGLMLIGMALMKAGVLGAERSAGFYRKMMVICYGIGLPLTAFSALDLQAHSFNALYAMGGGSTANYVGSVVVALGHIALVMLLIKTGFVQGLLRRFAAVGRMALTNYLMHSIILTTVFYGYGLGLYGSVPRFWQMGFVVAVIGLQLVLSPWWLARYQFGPAEWLWRSLTYWQRQPMSRP
jgi:uncharacterized protein